MKIKNKNEIIYPELSYKMCGLCFEAHNKLGRYLNEKQYCDYLERLFTENNLNFVREAPLPVSFPNEKERRNIPDFIIEPNKICPGYIMEIKGSNDKPELPYKCEAAKIYCLQHGMKFMLVPYDKVKKLVNWDKVKEYHYQHNKK